jgi:ornithine decarboxylase
MTSKLLFNKSELIQCYNKMKSVLNLCEIYYALKANGEIKILEVLNEINAKFEVASIGEFNRLLEVNVDPSKIICSLPVKCIGLIVKLYNTGCNYFVFDSIDEFKKILHYAPKAKKILRIYISDLDKESFQYGMTLEEVHECIRDIPGFFEMVGGVTFHISRNYRSSLITKIFDRVESILNEFNSENVKILNIGGGYRYDLPAHLAHKYDLNMFYKILNARLEQIKKNYNVILYAEPGRAVVESCGSLLAKIILVKKRNDSLDIYVDLNIGKLPGAHPSQINVVSNNNKNKECVYDLAWHINNSSNTEALICNFIDTTCEYGHFYTLPLKRSLVQGEVIELIGLGAYTICLSSNFHAREKPTVIIV